MNIKTLRLATFMLAIFFLCILPESLSAANPRPKREFRGAWIQCVNGQFQGLSTDRMQKTLSYQLDELQKYPR